MFYVYVIKSLPRNYVYVGITNNVDRRLSEHNSGYKKTTKPYAPFKLVLTESYTSRD
ncbi:MAG TPA: GIY-YIG nuclease family protein [Cyclobacteriaceae bacterium]|nr:GIY-YIG nuclease family protein [Cyclobacteriaceae bacterium]HRJ80777.1 GIY-YIG nuclease family protein [Cyclobacteriaceae bacterium]